MNLKPLLAWSVCAALLACGGGGSDPAGILKPSGYPSSAKTCDTKGQRDWLRDYMADQYFWNAQMGAPKDDAGSVADYFKSLLNLPTDHYSYSQSAAQFKQFFAEGKALGYGYLLQREDGPAVRYRVLLVEPLSPVGVAGLRRGDEIVSLNGFTPAQLASGALPNVTEEGIARAFVVKNSAGAQRSFTVNSAIYDLSPVLHNAVLTAPNSAKVGYLAYRSFINAGNAALGQAFNSFRAQGITELIVDMRYNGGGSVPVARDLASMMSGMALDAKLFGRLRFNAQNTAKNIDYNFTANASALPAAPLQGLGRVIFITSRDTASASELVINGLRPFMNVVLIGDTTFGKPYGSQPLETCDTTYSAINFDLVNAAGQGGYSNGLPATCVVPDDVTHALGDPAEQRIAVALQYVQTNACPAGYAAADSMHNSDFAQQIRAQAAIKNIANDPALGEVMPPMLWAD
jgi:carboxyl-terminal processing protease